MNTENGTERTALKRAFKRGITQQQAQQICKKTGPTSFSLIPTGFKQWQKAQQVFKNKAQQVCENIQNRYPTRMKAIQYQQQTQQIPNLNAGNTVSTNNNQPLNAEWLVGDRTATTGNPNRGNKLNIQRAIQDLLIYQAEPLHNKTINQQWG